MKRTTEIKLRIVWDDLHQDHPATWTWTAGIDAGVDITVIDEEER